MTAAEALNRRQEAGVTGLVHHAGTGALCRLKQAEATDYPFVKQSTRSSRGDDGRSGPPVADFARSMTGTRTQNGERVTSWARRQSPRPRLTGVRMGATRIRSTKGPAFTRPGGATASSTCECGNRKSKPTTLDLILMHAVHAPHPATRRQPEIPAPRGANRERRAMNIRPHPQLVGLERRHPSGHYP